MDTFFKQPFLGISPVAWNVPQYTDDTNMALVLFCAVNWLYEPTL